MYFSSQHTTLQTVILSFNFGLNLKKDPQSVAKLFVVKFDVCEYVQLTAQLEGLGQEWRLELEPRLTKCHPGGVIIALVHL